MREQLIPKLSSTCRWASLLSSSPLALHLSEVEAHGRIDLRDAVRIRDDDGLCFSNCYAGDEKEALNF